MAIENKIIRAVFGANRTARTIPLTRQDYGQVLQFVNADLPDVFQVHFSNSSDNGGTAKTQIGTAEGGVTIPDEYLIPGKTVYAWVFAQGQDSGRTVYRVEIPVAAKPTVTPEEPTPEQQSVIGELIEALNDGVERSEDAAESAEASAQNAATAETSATASATAAAQSATDAGIYAENAEASKTAANNYAFEASGSAENAANSATGAANAKADAETARDAARQSATNAEAAAGSIPQMWFGTQEQYDKLPEIDPGTIYYIEEDDA